MMQRIVGACMIMGAFFYSGINIVNIKKENIIALREMLRALRQLHAELNARLSPLPEITERLSETKGKYAPIFFSEISAELIHLGEISFEEIWRNAADKSLDCIGAPEKEELKRLGNMLGMYELEEQLNAILLCCTFLEEKLSCCEKKLAEQERTYIGICSALGVLVAVVFI